jgi:cysteinylglycine-S-conjugate dipeptidase
VQILDHGLHSGTFGGPALDAVTLLARLIATFHDEAGDVAVAGLPAAGDPALDISEKEYRQDSGLRRGAVLTGSGSIASRLWTKPALSVIGLNAPGVAVASNTLLPSASAKVSLRLAPGSDPAAAMDALRHHVQAHAPFGADVRFTPGSMTSPFAADTTAGAARAALWSMEQAWGVPPVQMGVGGSIPVVAELVDRFPPARVLITGAENPDSRAHGANESIHLGDFRKGILAEALLLAQLNRPT